jgi:hypothetical protein
METTLRHMREMTKNAEHAAYCPPVLHAGAQTDARRDAGKQADLALSPYMQTTTTGA